MDKNKCENCGSRDFYISGDDLKCKVCDNSVRYPLIKTARKKICVEAMFLVGHDKWTVTREVNSVKQSGIMVEEVEYVVRDKGGSIFGTKTYETFEQATSAIMETYIHDTKWEVLEV